MGLGGVCEYAMDSQGKPVNTHPRNHSKIAQTPPAMSASRHARPLRNFTNAALATAGQSARYRANRKMAAAAIGPGMPPKRLSAT